MWLRFTLLISLLLSVTIGWGQTLMGTVKDASTGKPLIGATLQIIPSGKGATTNDKGRFLFNDVQKAPYRLVASYVGFRPDTSRMLQPTETNVTLNFALSPAISELVVEVTDDRTRTENQLRISTDRLKADKISSLPVLLGEADVLRSLQLLPGVQAGVEGQAGFFVRGGSPDQNLILLDGTPIYNPNHVFGFFSAFDVSAIEAVSLTKGGFPARYGGRLSSLVEIDLKNGSPGQPERSLSISPLLAKASYGGGLGPQTSIFVAARRTLFDLLAAPFVANAANNAGREDQERNRFNFFFGDTSVKLRHRFSSRNELSGSLYYGQDQYDRLLERNVNGARNVNDERLAWINLLGSLQFRRVWSERLTQRVQLGYSNYNYTTGNLVEDERSTGKVSFGLDYSAGITDLNGRTDLTLGVTPNYTLRSGVGFAQRSFATGTFRQRNENTTLEEATLRDTSIVRPGATGMETFAYLENIFNFGDRLSVNAGVHFSMLDGKFGRLQPRFNLRQEIGEKTALKVGYAAMRQYLHLVVSGSIGLPQDLWVPANEALPPQDSWQATLGVERELTKGWKLVTEAYYKVLSNNVNFRPGAGINTIAPWESLLLVGDGTAYGTEWQLRRDGGRFNGWLSYTLSWSWRTFAGLNRGEQFPFRYDQRHNLRLVGNYTLRPEKTFLNATFTFVSGAPVTITNNEVNAGANAIGALGALPYRTFLNVNDFRIPPTHRLDVGITFRKQTSKRLREFTLGAYNLYGRRNPYYVNVRLTPAARVQGELVKVSLFRVVPNVAYTLKW